MNGGGGVGARETKITITRAKGRSSYTYNVHHLLQVHRICMHAYAKPHTYIAVPRQAGRQAGYWPVRVLSDRVSPSAGRVHIPYANKRWLRSHENRGRTVQQAF